jgi:serine/threonine protein kinase
MLAVQGLLKTMLRSGLFSREQLRELLRTVPESRRTDPESLADYLVETGHLTRFQARKLLQGTALGLTLGAFQILAPIGKGGMSTVYLARDTRSHLLLALKVLPPKRAREEERLLARFRREMEMCQRVAHPHLAWTYDVGVCRGVYYIAMEYIPGRSLYRLVSDEGPLAIARAARLFSEVASALDHAHHQGSSRRTTTPRCWTWGWRSWKASRQPICGLRAAKGTSWARWTTSPPSKPRMPPGWTRGRTSTGWAVPCISP